MPVSSQPFPEIGLPSERSRNIFKRLSITVEPIIFICIFLFSLTDGVSTNIMISKTCNVIYGLPLEECEGKLNPKTESMVQSYTTQITMVKSIIESVIAGIISMFVGSWSDTNGRKPFIILPLAGYVLYFISWYIFIALPTVSPLWILVPSVFANLSGGLVSVFICVFAYITDVTNENNRAFRMGVIYSTMMLGAISGYLTSNCIYDMFGSSTPTLSYAVASSASFVALLYAIFLIPESITPQQDSSRRFFNLKGIKETWGVVFMYRPKNATLILLMEAFIIVIAVIIMSGDSGYRYYAVRKSFNWSLKNYNIYSGSLAGVSVVASTIGSYISSSILRAHDLYIAMFVALTSSLSCVLLALSRTSTEFYLFSIVGCFGLLLNPMLKTQISKTVNKSDLGKYFAFMSTLEAFVPLLTSPLYRTVYSAVLDIQPLLFFFLSASFWMLSSFLILSVLLIQAFSSRHYNELLINAEEENIANTSDTEA